MKKAKSSIKKIKVQAGAGQVRLLPGSLAVYHPHFVGPGGKRVRAIVKLGDGRYSEMEDNIANSDSAFIRDVFLQYTVAEIQTGSRREASLRAAFQELQAKQIEDRFVIEERARTSHAKQQALSLPEVQSCRDSALLSKIRQAKSTVEVAAWTAVLLTRAARPGRTSTADAELD